MTYELPAAAVRTQLERCLELPFYRDRFDGHGVDPAEVADAEAFREIPFMDRDDVLDDVGAADRFGGLYHPDTSMVCFTPTGSRGLMPEYHTDRDLAAAAAQYATLYADAGLDADDVVLNTFGYHYFGAAHIFHRGATEVGATVIPGGPGETERAVSLIEQYDVTTLISNPSFAQKLAAAGAPSVETVLATGEPFTTVPGYRDEVEAAFAEDVIALDSYALSEVCPVAGECTEKHGLHLATDAVYAEVIDPDTGEVVDLGDRGELVLTHLDRESMPLVRYRTGDLTVLDRVECNSEERLTMPRGVFGRVDDMTKVKGLKFFPDELGPLIAAVDGLTGEYHVRITREDRTDHIELVCEGDAPADAVRAAVEAELIQSIDEVRVVDELDAEGVLTDERSG